MAVQKELMAAPYSAWWGDWFQDPVLCSGLLSLCLVERALELWRHKLSVWARNLLLRYCGGGTIPRTPTLTSSWGFSSPLLNIYHKTLWAFSRADKRFLYMNILKTINEKSLSKGGDTERLRTESTVEDSVLQWSACHLVSVREFFLCCCSEQATWAFLVIKWRFLFILTLCFLPGFYWFFIQKKK